MKNRPLVAGCAAAVLLGVLWYASKSTTQAVPKSIIATERKELNLTIYHDDFGMVREVRPNSLQQGENHLYLRDVSNQLDPQSILLRWLGNDSQTPQTTSHAYDLGVKTGESLLHRYMGKEVEVVRYNQSGYPSDTQKGTLMAGENGSFVLQSGDKFYVQPQGTMVVPTLPDVIPMPQVSLQATSNASQSANLEFSYLTRGLSWSTDYTGTLSPDSDTMNLECWATVLNKTGTNYPNAKVTLVAGSPNRATVAGGKMEMKVMREEMMMQRQMPAARDTNDAEKGRFANPQALGDLHSYAVKTPTTVVQEQMNRLLMLGSKMVKVLRDYNTRFPSLQSYYGMWGGEPANHKCSVAVGLTFYNTENNALGEPLPEGAIRLYEPDKEGIAQFIGAGNIGDTPKDEKVYLTLSSSFDVFADWKLVKNQKIDKKTVQKFVEVTLHNQKAHSVAFRAIQGYSGYWKILQESEKSVRLNAYESQWTVTVPGNSTTVLRYTVEMKM